MLYTSSIKYSGSLRALDITVKGQHSFGKYFAPTWSMVMDYKKTGNIEKYLGLYLEILKRNHEQVDRMAQVAIKHNVVIKCFCPAGAFCHRVLFAEYLTNKYGVIYGGEI